MQETETVQEESTQETVLGSVTAEEAQPVEEPETPLDEPPQEDQEPVVEEPASWEPDDLEVPDEWKADEVFKSYVEHAKEIGLPKEGAQKMLDFYRQVRENEFKAFQETRAKWAEESKKFLGPNATEKQATIAKALEWLDQETEVQFREIMDATGVGDHPAVVKVIYELAKRAVGGGFTQGKPVTQEKRKSLAEIFYPHMKE